MVALAAGKEAFSDYSHKFSPQKFTQPQLFACLVLKEFERKDYRGIHQLLLDCPDLRQAIGLHSVPHFTTLQKASRRLLRLGRVRRLLNSTVQRVLKRRRVVSYAAGDSSGFDARHASRYYVHRRDADKSDENRPKKRVIYQRFGKLMLIVCCLSHAIVALVASEGPTPDIDQLDDVLAETPKRLRLRHMVLDAGFDSAHNHRLLREDHGIVSTIPPRHGRPAVDPRRVAQRQIPATDENPLQPQSLPKTSAGGDGMLNAQTQLGLGPSRPKPPLTATRHAAAALTHTIALALLRVFYRAGHFPLWPSGLIKHRPASTEPLITPKSTSCPSSVFQRSKVMHPSPAALVWSVSIRGFCAAAASAKVCRSISGFRPCMMAFTARG